MKKTLQSACLLSLFAFFGISNTTEAQVISAGGGHSLFLCSNGSVRAVGSNNLGQTGWTGSSNFSTPQQANVPGTVIAVSAGGEYSLFLKSDGTVWGVGKNTLGQLGDGTNVNRNTPQQVPGLSNIVAVSAGTTTSLFLKNDGTVWASGTNGNGALGIPSTSPNTLTPTMVPSLSGIVGIAAGYNASYFIKNDGTVWATGWNAYGQLGFGDNVNRSTPEMVTGLSNVVAVSASQHQTLSHAVFLKGDGTVWTSGYNEYGQLGIGTTTNSLSPVQVSSLSDIVAIDAGRFTSHFVKNNGTVWASGYNLSGALGDGTNTDRSIPVQATSLSGITAVSGGFGHTLYLKNDGSVWGSGFNGGSLGDGTTTNRNIPVQTQLGCTITVSAEEDTSVSLFSVFPNPANNNFIVAGASSGTPYSLVNMLGQQVAQGVLDSEAATIDISGLNTGIYVLRVGLNSTQHCRILKK